MDEIEYFYKRGLFIIEFMINIYQDDIFLKNFKNLILKSYENKNVKEVKMLSRDINSWAKGLPQNIINDLEILLNKNFGENLSGDKISIVLIKKILKNNKIDSFENYRIVQEYLNDISSHDYFYRKRNILELLLSNFDSEK